MCIRDSGVDRGRSPKLQRKLDGVGDTSRDGPATDRKSVAASCETVSRRSSRSSQTGDPDAERRSRRRELYWRYADVLYTNADNLEHTIAVQQALFRQQLGTGGGDDPRDQQRAPAVVDDTPALQRYPM